MLDRKNLRIAGNARTPVTLTPPCFQWQEEHAAWIIPLVATQQTVTNLVRSGRKQR